MPLAEGVAALVTYKFYASGEINTNSEPAIATDPGASGGQRLRRVACTLDLTKQTFESEEFRSDRQLTDMRHGTRSVGGDISGELSPGTYADFFQAVFRGSWAATVANITNTQATNVATDNATATFTFGGGDISGALGVRVGSVLRPASGLIAANLNVNFVVLEMTGTQGRTVRVFPAPTTQSAQTTFSIAVLGRRLVAPNTGHVRRKLAVEVFNEDLDVSRLFTEIRLNSANITVPPNGMVTTSFGAVGRNMVPLSGAAAPFFTSPTVETVTGICAGANGVITVAGLQVGNVTQAEINMELASEAEPVIGQVFVPEIFLGRFRVSGTMTVYFENLTMLNYFVNETEVGVMLYLTASSAPNADAITVFLPRVKFGGAQLPAQGEGGQTMTMPFVALRHPGNAAAGIDSTTMQIVDTTLT